MATRIAMVVDASGSMSSVYKSTLDGFKEYVQDQKADKSDETFMTLVTFNTHASVNASAAPIESINDDLKHYGYSPNGGTALYDGISYGVSELERTLEPDDSALVVVITDGYENSSRETTQKQVLDLIKTKENSGNWTFAYLGADQDAWANAQHMGFTRGQTMSYSSAETVGTYSMLSSNTSKVKAARAGGARGQSVSSLSLVDLDDQEDTVVNP